VNDNRRTAPRRELNPDYRRAFDELDRIIAPKTVHIFERRIRAIRKIAFASVDAFEASPAGQAFLAQLKAWDEKNDRVSPPSEPPPPPTPSS